jgi:hypothetical protein
MARIVCNGRFDGVRRKAVIVRDVVSDVLANSTVNRHSLRNVSPRFEAELPADLPD